MDVGIGMFILSIMKPDIMHTQYINELYALH